MYAQSVVPHRNGQSHNATILAVKQRRRPTSGCGSSWAQVIPSAKVACRAKTNALGHPNQIGERVGVHFTDDDAAMLLHGRLGSSKLGSNLFVSVDLRRQFSRF
jgi:hypothetical protein